MRIIEVDQNSDDWYWARAGIPTASQFSKIVTTAGKRSATLPKYAMSLASEKLVTDLEDGFCGYFMERGKELEPEAIDAYQKHTLTKVDRVGFCIIDDGICGSSPDALIGDDGGLEIKCPNQSTHASYMHDNKLPTDYIQQVQGNLFVTGRKWWDFVSFHPNFIEEKRLFIKRIYPDHTFIRALSDRIVEVNSLRDEYFKKIMEVN